MNIIFTNKKIEKKNKNKFYIFVENEKIIINLSDYKKSIFIINMYYVYYCYII